MSNGDLLLSVRLEGICHFGNAKSLAIGSRLPKILRGGETGLGVDNTFLSLCQRLFRLVYLMRASFSFFSADFMSESAFL